MYQVDRIYARRLATVIQYLAPNITHCIHDCDKTCLSSMFIVRRVALVLSVMSFSQRRHWSEAPPRALALATYIESPSPFQHHLSFMVLQRPPGRLSLHSERHYLCSLDRLGIHHGSSQAKSHRRGQRAFLQAIDACACDSHESGQR